MSDESLNFAKRGLRPVTKLLILSMLSSVLLALDNRYSVISQAKKYTATALYPLQWLANQPVEWYDYSSSFLQSQSYLLNENQRLMSDNVHLKMQANQMQAQTRELATLKSLLKLQEEALKDSIAGEIISSGKEPLSNRLIVNKGTSSGVVDGDAVIDEYGVLGQVRQSHPLSAEIALISDSRSVIPVTVARTGVRSLVYGNGDGVMLPYFPTDADLKPEDILLTSGLDSIYPAGIPVAKVMHTSRDVGTPYYVVQLQPMAQLRSSKYVLILPQINRLSEMQAASQTPDNKAIAP